jgi:DNA-binding XRE family transcriptional regulator
MYDDILKEKHMTIEQLAEKSGVSEQSIKGIFRENSCLPKCHVETGYKIAKALDMNLSELYETIMGMR